MKRVIPQFFRLCLLFIAVVAGTSSAFGWDAVQTTIDGITYEATSSAGSTVIAVDPSLEDVTIPKSYEYVYYGKTYSSTVIALDFSSETLKKLSVSSSVDIKSFLSKQQTPNLTEVEVQGKNLWKKENENWCNLSFDLKTLNGVILNTPTFQIPDGVEIISTSAFSGCRGLTEVTISESVTSIEKSALSGCNGLKKVIFNAENCSKCGGYDDYHVFPASVTELNIGDKVKIIPAVAFYGCSRLTEVTIPNSVTSIGSSAFKNCKGLTKAEFSSIEHLCSINFGNAYANPLCYAENLYINGEEVKDLVIPEAVTSIGSSAFEGCSGLISVTIPNSVTSIGTAAFEGCSGLTSVTIPNSVTSIGRGAFYGCSGLTSVTIGNSVESIGVYTFYGCSGLTSVTIPNSVESIGEYAFEGDSGLKEVIIGNSVTSIHTQAFSGCTGLIRSAYPNTISDPFSSGIRLAYDPRVAIIEDKVIYGPDKSSILYASITLEGEFVIPNSVTSIGSSAFEGCSGLTEVRIPEFVTSIGNSAFSGCNELKKVNFNAENCSTCGNSNSPAFPVSITELNIGDKVKNIPQYAFSGCSGLTSVTIPNSVTSIGSSAFEGCSGLTEVRIPEFVTSIGNSAFSGCNELKKVNFNAENCSTCGNSNSPAFSVSITELNIGDKVKSIPQYAFSGCSGLTSVTIPNSVTSIGDNAFSGCSDLKEITISDGETILNFGNNVFQSTVLSNLYMGRNFSCSGSYDVAPFATNSNLKELIIGDYVTSICRDAFYNCSGLKSVVIGNSVESIDTDAFNDCINLTELIIGNSVTSIGEAAFCRCKSLTGVTIPESVTSIGNSAFYSCTGLKEVIIPNNVKSIGFNAFRGCSSLTEVIIGKSVESIGKEAFKECSSMKKSAYPNTIRNPFSSGIIVAYNPEGAIIDGKSIYGPDKSSILYASITLEGEFVIPESVTSIGNFAFYSCSGLTEVIIPESVESIGENAFYGCSGMTEVTIPESVTSIGNSTFFGCTGLLSVTIPESVTSIGNSTFFGCTGLLSVTIPNSVTSIGNSAFEGCSGVQEVTIPESVESIGNAAFFICSGLTSVTIGNSVESIGENAFSGCSRLNTINFNAENCSKCGAIYPAFPSTIAELNIGDKVKNIPDRAFSGCSGLTSVIIPNSVTSIGSSAFDGCSGLKNLYSLAKVPAKIENSSFSGLYDTVKLEVPAESVADYLATAWSLFKTLYQSGSEDAVVTYNDGLLNYRLIRASNDEEKNIAIVISGDYSGEITVPERFTYTDSENTPQRYYVEGIGYGAFQNSSVNTLSFNSRIDLKSIGDYAFAGSSLSSLEIPSTVTSIGSSAFSGCSGLSSIIIPSNVTSIGSSAFSGCSRLSSIIIPSNVTSIGSSAFYDCSGLTSVTLNEGLQQVASSTFSGCSKLSSIKIPSTVKTIGEKAFYNCPNLKSVSLSENLETIGVSAFSMDNENDVRFSLTIPASMQSIAKDAFLNRNLSKVVINDLQAWCNIDFENKDSNPAAWTSEGLWLNDEKIINLVIPDGVKEIKPFAFLISPVKCYDFEEPLETYQSGIKGRLKSVVIPNSVKSIGEGAFYYNGFTEIIIPASVDYIGSTAFTGGNINYSYTYNSSTRECNLVDKKIATLKKITLEDSKNLITIDANAFKIDVIIPASENENAVTKTLWNAPASLYLGRPLGSLPNGLSGSLQDLQLGNALTEIPECGFSDCSVLTNVTVGNSIVEIPNNAFSNKSKLKSLTLGNSLTAIGENAFSGCTALTKVVVPPSVETIGASAFAGNTALATIIMGHNVKTIGEKAFDGCPANTVSITAQTPPTAPNNTFSNYSGKLYLQGQEALDAYYDAFTCWDRFDSYVMVEPTEIKYTGENKITGKPGDTFQLNATLMPKNVTLPQVFWRSSNPEIATVDANGLVTLHADTSEVMSVAENDEESVSSCKIIAESLYADGPMLEVTVSNIETGIDEILTDGVIPGTVIFNDSVEVYNMNGLKVSNSTDNLAPGIYIVRQGKSVKKIAVK